MGRSIKKGPFVQPKLLERVQKMNANGEKHVDYFSLMMAGREDEYEELEAKLQEMIKNGQV